MEKLSSKKRLLPQVMELIRHSLHTVKYGHLILTVQDGYVIKMERTEKFIFTAKNKSGYIVQDVPARQHSFQPKIIAQLEGLMYGQLIIRIEDGKVEQIEKTEKRRINEQEGIYGDGI
ncbi:DUF2292 domain-containing protein [Sporomusa sphaeroides]|uniref:DUF2292 domain-containing protein n=2 Tax=Sporomusa TaxID=2375 RepID=A0ABM9VYL1_9FIRM|nr:DUF2292 domain-containing protein [Sporomusa sphaeroides]OLS57464.1 hypothetical protein SPSPH_09800 [Sporomusa sphaeroides DSM 2875]CVK17972.1 hypothetical protein SSPH_00608 [Sporomusa sphaeroides DSM 2875]SCM81201.1 conserved hypothetical protein [uncultured Sporomusa sp.]